MSKPFISHPEIFEKYVSQVKEDNLKEALNRQLPAAENFLRSISNDFSLRKYAEGKWTIKEVLQHINDAERIFAYRALCFARQDQATFHSFDENAYTQHSRANARDWNELINEFVAIRKATEFLYNSFNDDVLKTIGKASTYAISISSLGFVIVGHVSHHLRIIQERYIGV